MISAHEHNLFDASEGGALRAEIEAALLREKGRVFALHASGRRLWVKRAVKTKLRVGHRLQDWAAVLLGVELLRQTAGGETLDREARILRALAAKGVRVPEVVAQGEDWLALSDLGDSVRVQMDRAATPSELRALVLTAAYALRHLHANGAWHGSPLVRNLVGQSNRIGFIDFEEDPAASMSEAACVARDILLFLFSLSPFEKRVPGILNEAVSVLVNGQGAAVVAHLRAARRAVAPILFGLRPFRRWMGRDVRSLFILQTALDVVRVPVRPAVRWSVVGGVGSMILLALYAVLSE
jgi:tRNA A-37 threonylcarbamoyl transferase component Bud32